MFHNEGKIIQKMTDDQDKSIHERFSVIIIVSLYTKKADVLNHICSLNLSETSGSGSGLFHGCAGLSDIGVGVEGI